MRRLVPERNQRAIGSYRWTIPLTSFLLAWEVVAYVQLLPSSILPPFSHVLARFLYSAIDVSFLGMLAATVGSLALGIALAFCVAVPLGLVAGLRQGLDSTITPLLIMFGALPDLALLPILLRWIGPNQMLVVAMAALVAFFPIFLTLREGTRAIPAEYFYVSRSFGSGHWETFTKVVMPAVVPSTVTGLRLANELVWEVVLGVEIIAHVAGLGTFIDAAAASGAMESAFAGIMAVGFLVLFVDQLVFRHLEESVRRWHE